MCKAKIRGKIMSDANNIGKYLESVLKAKSTVTYSSITNKFSLPEFNGVWVAHPLCQIFEVIDQQDAIAKRPFRTSVVISKNNNTPGTGFFEALQRLKQIPTPSNKEMREALWIKELNSAYSYPW